MQRTTRGAHRDETNTTFSDRDGVMFMLAGTGHAIHLCAAVFQLRVKLGFDGRIAVVTTDDRSKEVVGVMKGDQRFDVEHIHRPMEKAGPGKGGHYANKTRMIDLTPFEDRTVFLDADTLVMNVDPESDFQLGRMLPPNAYTPEVMLTQFSNWVTTGHKMQKRIKKWNGIRGAELVAAMTAHGYPAINTGVFGFSKLTRDFFREWNALAFRNVSFICDEIAAQLVFPKFPHRVLLHNLNASVIYSEIPDEEVGVWHGHGWKFAKSAKGRSIFMPIAIEMARMGFGFCNRWIQSCGGKMEKCLLEGKFQDESENWTNDFQKAIDGKY